MKRFKTALVILTAAVYMLSGVAPVGSSAGGTSDEVRWESAFVPDESGETLERGSNVFTLYGREGNLELWIDEQALNIAVLDTATGQLYSTSPVDADNDPLAADKVKAAMKSLLSVSLYTDLAVAMEMNAWEECVERGQFTVRRTGTGAAVDMTTGRDDSQSLVSPAFTKDFFENKILANIDDEYARERLNYFYKLRSADFFGSPEDEPEEGEEMSEYEQMVTAFPLLLEEELYICRDLEEMDYLAVNGFLKESGISLSDVAAQKEKIGIRSDEDETAIVIGMSVEFSLAGGRLIASLPIESIRLSDGFFLHKITFLPYFGAAPTGSDGWLLLPDGCGSLIPFNDDRHATQQLLTGRVYGRDYASGTDTINTLGFPMPCFGIKAGDSAVFACILEGEANATISGSLNNFNTSYSTAYAEFLYMDYDAMVIDEFSGQALVPQSHPGYDRITVAYDLLSGDGASLSGMAASCRKVYFPDTAAAQKAAPVFVDVLGLTSESRRVLGVDINVSVPLTTFEQAGDIAEELAAGDRLVMRLVGAANDGLTNRAYSRLRPESKLGGRAGLRKLSERMRTLGATLLFDVNLSDVSRTGLFDGFSESAHTNRTINGLTVRASVPDRASTQAIDLDIRVPLRAVTAASYAVRIRKAAEEFGLAGLSYGSLARRLTSDFRKSNATYRSEAQALYEEILALSPGMTAVDGPNAYAWKNAEYLLSLPDTNSEFHRFGQTVPFMQMVLHGRSLYALEPANTQPDHDDYILRCVAFGAAPYYTVAMENCSSLRMSDIGREYYSVSYEYWKPYILKGMEVTGEALRATAGAAMVGYDVLAPLVTRTAYDNGVAVIVNRSDTPYVDEAGGLTIEARSYRVVR